MHSEKHLLMCFGSDYRCNRCGKMFDNTDDPDDYACDALPPKVIEKPKTKSRAFNKLHARRPYTPRH